MGQNSLATFYAAALFANETTLVKLIEMKATGFSPLAGIIQKAQEDDLWVIFDLDSTLFNVSHRTQSILRSLAEHPEFLEDYPEEAVLLKKIEISDRDWGIRSALERAKIRGTIGFFERIRSYWVEHFFSNGFLHVDRPYKGALEFVQELDKAGAHIQYLTGRDQERMGEGSLASLKQWGFPLHDDADLILKPDKSMDDAEFKKDYFLKIHEEHENLWLFENEPRIIHLIRKHCPAVQIVFMDSVHSGRALPPSDLPVISLGYEF